MYKRFVTLMLLTATAPLAGAQTQPPTAGLQLHLKADAGVTETAGTVSTWADQSGNGFDFAPPSGAGPALVPDVINGLPALRFDGTVQLDGDLMQTLGEATIVSLSRYSVASSNNDYLYTFGVDAASGSQMSLARRDGDDIYHFDGSMDNSPGATCVPDRAFLPVVQVFGDATAESHDLYQDGELALASAASNPYAADVTRSVIGNWTSGNFRFQGDLVEVLVYNRVLTPAERAQAEAYLRERIGVTFSRFDLTNTVQYEFGQQSDATWATCAGGTAATQATNADASILLADVDATNTVLRGTMRAGNAPDYMGLVIGYQDRGSYYLFDWKRVTASFADFGQADVGMSLRIVDTLDGADPTGADLWGSVDSANVTTLRDNDLPWAANTTYEYTVRFTPGQIDIDIHQDEVLIESWSVADSTFTGGGFGVYINSLQGVTFGPVSVESLGPDDTDGDGVEDTLDNCITIANADQQDSNGDGFGNRCDADLNNDCTVNFVDLGLLRSVFFGADADADLSGDGVVNFIDLGVMRSLFFQPPGPSGVPNGCGSR
jgi:hypothetical protein